MKLAVLRVNAEMLRKVLCVPEGGEVIEVRTRPGYHGEVELIVAGIGQETPPGYPLPPGSVGFVRTVMGADGFELHHDIEWDNFTGLDERSMSWDCDCAHPKGGRRPVDPRKNYGLPFRCNDCERPWRQKT